MRPAAPAGARLRRVVTHLLPAQLHPVATATPPRPSADGYGGLVVLFESFRRFQRGVMEAEEPDFAARAVSAQYAALGHYQQQLAALGSDLRSWSVPEQVDYHLVRAEMNGLEFRHRVMKPWVKDPGFYVDVIPRVRLDDGVLPLDAAAAERAEQLLRRVRAVISQAMRNMNDLSAVAADLGTLAVYRLEEYQQDLEHGRQGFATHHPQLVPALQDALAAIDEFVSWIEDNRALMVAAAGCGTDNYNWLLKNVYLVPHTFDEVLTILELEDNRVVTFQALEATRNRDKPQIVPAQSQAEYRAHVHNAIEHLMQWYHESGFWTISGKLPEAADILAGSAGTHPYESRDPYLDDRRFNKTWHSPTEETPGHAHDYFFNFSHREPLMEEAHELSHHFDDVRMANAESTTGAHPIRGPRMWAEEQFKMAIDRNEGLAFGLEEMLMHAGLLDGRNPHAREIVYEQASFRTVRGLADLNMHSGRWSLADAMEYCVSHAPHGELLDGSHHLWYELETTLRGVGHHMLMILGKTQLMRLFRTRVAQLGDNFVLRDFMDFVADIGWIPWSLIRWELTGFDDELQHCLAA